MMTKLTKARALDRLEKAIAEIDPLRDESTSSQKFQKWQRDTEVLLRHTFGDKSKHALDFEHITYTPFAIVSGGSNDSAFRIAYQNGLTTAAAMLTSMHSEVLEYWGDDTSVGQTIVPTSTTDSLASKEVFVVHGRDHGAKAIVSRFLTGVGLTPIVLHEQPNKGRTIIEKFEDHSDVGYAVVLCTPDDVGALADDEGNLKSRPRQNVVLEWGFFLGTLGRERVCALVAGDIEFPSDYAGVLYVELDDAGGWKLRLAQELRQAGLSVDLNRLGG